ncbi:hypothetical protein FB451DRAFT_1195172 [Mycena latifolia]|nr:hypothetical protein FB451DRAFT_1195172 [Mycena latifolia]
MYEIQELVTHPHHVLNQFFRPDPVIIAAACIDLPVHLEASNHNHHEPPIHGERCKGLRSSLEGGLAGEQEDEQFEGLHFAKISTLRCSCGARTDCWRSQEVPAEVEEHQFREESSLWRLERQIFELTAFIYPEDMPDLLRVAQRVKIWLQFHLQFLQPYHNLDHLVTAKPPSFFQDHVHHALFVGIRPIEDIMIVLSSKETRPSGFSRTAVVALLPVSAE